jgi:hypothetical protein
MLIKILIALAGIVFVFVAIVATRPSEAVHLFLDMDTMIGGNFEKGLADMKSVVEGAARPS